MARRGLAVLVIGIVSLALVGYGPAAPSPSAGSGDAISLANELGYLKEEGFDLDLQVANGSSAVVQQLGAGNAEIGVILAPNTLLGFAEGVKYKAFYDFLTKNTFDVKVIESSPISRPADLKGKRIGTIDLT